MVNKESGVLHFIEYTVNRLIVKIIGRLAIFKMIVCCSPTWVYFLILFVHLAHMAKWALSYTQQSSPLAGNNSGHLQLNRNRLMDPALCLLNDTSEFLFWEKAHQIWLAGTSAGRKRTA